MELNKTEITTPPRPAATVVLLRDADEGLEVLMIRRHAQSDVLGGAYVFPGGKLDPADSEIAVTQRIDALADDLHLALGNPTWTRRPPRHCSSPPPARPSRSAAS
jgi:8-oxo-dGTP pyrophosphatase MutT (NUDIX family)